MGFMHTHDLNGDTSDDLFAYTHGGASKTGGVVDGNELCERELVMVRARLYAEGMGLDEEEVVRQKMEASNREKKAKVSSEVYSCCISSVVVASRNKKN
jgi:hypothetical protein